MGLGETHFESDEVENLVAWWRDAGVDTMIDEAPRHWLSTAVAAPLPVAPVVVPALPKTLDAFVDWLMHADLPEAGPSQRRVRPSGNPSAGLMILTDLPELADIEAGMLIAGELEAMFDRMLGKLGRGRNSVYLASLNPGRPPSGRISDAALESFAEAARRHVALAAPEQLWLMGKAASRALLGIDDVAASGKLHAINLGGVMIETIATAHPRLLNGSNDMKKRAWTEMQRLLPGSV